MLFDMLRFGDSPLVFLTDIQLNSTTVCGCYSELVCVCSRIHGFGFHCHDLNAPLKGMCASSCWGGYSNYSRELSLCWWSLVHSYLKTDFPGLLFLLEKPSDFIYLFIEKNFSRDIS